MGRQLATLITEVLATRSQLYRFCFSLVYLFVGGCALLPKPDTCERSSCMLEPTELVSPAELPAPGSVTDNISHAIVQVCACRPWNRTGIKVEKGQEYAFQIVERTEEWVDGDVKSTPEDGWTTGLSRSIGHAFSLLKRSPKANWYALVGTVGKADEGSFAVFNERLNSSESLPETSRVTLSSDWLSIVMGKTGEIYLYANDMNGRYFNNKGILQLKITRTK